MEKAATDGLKISDRFNLTGMKLTGITNGVPCVGNGPIIPAAPALNSNT